MLEPLEFIEGIKSIVIGVELVFIMRPFHFPHAVNHVGIDGIAKIGQGFKTTLIDAVLVAVWAIGFFLHGIEGDVGGQEDGLP